MYDSNILKNCRYDPAWQRGPSLEKVTEGWPGGASDWLLDPDSLTRNLRRLTAAFEVQLLNCGEAFPEQSECKALKQSCYELAFVRDVVLCGEAEPWVIGHTVIPLTSLVGDNQVLRNVDSGSLGDRLFAHPSLRRDEFEFAAVSWTVTCRCYGLPC